MSIQIANSTSDENTLIFSPTTDAVKIIPNNILINEENRHGREFDNYSPNVISLLDKYPIVGTNIWVQNPSPSDANKLESLSQTRIIKITLLPNKKLRESIDAILEPDDEGYIVRTIDLPLYGYGDDPIEAIQNLKYEIESVYDDLMEDDNFSEEWLKYKSYLGRIIYVD
jgi:hypothetical protein